MLIQAGIIGKANGGLGEIHHRLHQNFQVVVHIAFVSQPLAVRRPGRRAVVGGGVGDLGEAAGGQIEDVQVPVAVAARAVGQASAVGAEGRVGFVPFGRAQAGEGEIQGVIDKKVLILAVAHGEQQQAVLAHAFGI